MASVMQSSVPRVQRHFTEEEAKSLVGKGVSLVADLKSAPLGTTGKVVDYHQEVNSDDFQVVVRFEVRKKPEPVYELFDWSKYERFLREV